MLDTNLTILYPAYPGDMSRVDPAFEDEAVEAKKQGYRIGYVDVEMMFGGEIKLKIPPRIEGYSIHVMYRGWILKQDVYNELYVSLLDRGYFLINTPADYEFSQNIPLWYPYLQGMTPESVWIPGTEFKEEDIHSSLERFGSSSVILKDYMKSRKQDWYDACFIRDASDKTEVMRVVNNFLRLQGESLQGGLVFRKYEELEKIGIHPKSQMPLVNEWRIFKANNREIAAGPYWEGGWYDEFCPKINLPDLPIPFYTIDVAKKVTGEWIVIEIGDGGSSGIPTAMKPYELYLGWSKRNEPSILDQMQRICEASDS